MPFPVATAARPGSTPRHPRRGMRKAVRHAAGVAAFALALAGGCGDDDTAPFARSAPAADGLHIAVSEIAATVDPALAGNSTERMLARQLYAPLLGPGRTQGLALEHEVVDRPDGGQRVLFHLREDARWSDGQPITAHHVVSSWQRVLRPSTRAPAALALLPVDGARELLQGGLLAVRDEALRPRRPPFVVFSDARALEPPTDGSFAVGDAVRALDSNVRRPCCGEPVPLFGGVDDQQAAVSVGAFYASETALLLGMRVASDRAVWAQVRTQSGLSGWAREDQLSPVFPAVDVRRVLAPRQGLPLWVEPRADAAVVTTVEDDQEIELLGVVGSFVRVRLPDDERIGYLADTAIDAITAERPWLFVERGGAEPLSGWVPAEALMPAPERLGARATSLHRLEVDVVEGGLDDLFAALPLPVARPLRVDVIERTGRVSNASSLITSGPYRLASLDPDGAVLVQSPTSFEAGRAHTWRVVVTPVPRGVTAVHLYRAGRVDVVAAGLVPAELAEALSRRPDLVATPAGAALVAPFIVDLDAATLDLRGVTLRMAP